MSTLERDTAEESGREEVTGLHPILRLEDVHKRFPLERRLFGQPRSFIYAVNGVSLSLFPGRTVGLVGESGCGKSTVGKMICLLERPEQGSIRFRDADVHQYDRRQQMSYYRQVQMIFQNPYTSLNPRQRIGSMLKEIYKVHKLCPPAEIEDRMSQTLAAVGLAADARYRYPFEFSGGQRQRLCIARALTVDPQVIVCDEPVSALDVSIQAQILKLLTSLQNERNLAYLFISHDLSVVYHVCDEVMVMYMGQIVEQGPVESLFANPKHPYTRALLSAIPMADPGARRRHIILSGELPSPTKLYSGCPFFSRCRDRLDKCEHQMPPVKTEDAHQVRCWLHED